MLLGILADSREAHDVAKYVGRARGVYGPGSNEEVGGEGSKKRGVGELESCNRSYV